MRSMGSAKQGVRAVACKMQHNREADSLSSVHQNVARARAINIPILYRWTGHGGAAKWMMISPAGQTEVVGLGFGRR
jgi:hypothetical protein